jgi:hypothetical protein
MRRVVEFIGQSHAGRESTTIQSGPRSPRPERPGKLPRNGLQPHRSQGTLGTRSSSARTAYPLSWILSEGRITGIRRWRSGNKDAAGNSIFLASGRGSTARTCPSYRHGLCAVVSTIRKKIPYLLVWKDEKHDDKIKEAVRLARYVGPSISRMTDNYVELKRTDGSTTVLRILWQMLPRNGGRVLLLVCSYCNALRRHVYG